MDIHIAKTIETFFSRYPLKRYKKGQILIYANEAPLGVIYLVTGNVRQYDISERGDELVVNVFKPPAFFPMSWAINKIPNRYFFEAETAVELRQAPRDDIVMFMKTHPEVTYDLLSRLYTGVEGLLRRTAHLMGSTARRRLLFELAIESTRFGEVQEDGTHKITIKEGEFAGRTGLSRETVNREFSKLKKQGFLFHEKGVTQVYLQKIKDELGNEL